MGIYRGWPECGFTLESNDEIITNKLWPIIKEIIMTNIENNQHIIMESASERVWGGKRHTPGYFRFWCEQGFFEALWVAGLHTYNETVGINWDLVKRIPSPVLGRGSFAFMINRFRELLVGFEKLKSSYLGLLMFTCAFMAFRKADVI
jgi:hypothetical protein